MDEKILQELQEIKKELQEIRSILEPKDIKATIIIDNKKHSDVEEFVKQLASSMISESQRLPNHTLIIPL